MNQYRNIICISIIVLMKGIIGQCYKPLAFYESAPAPRSLELERKLLALPSPSFTIEADALVINGAVVVGGQLPFVSAVALDGVVPSTGRGRVVHSCGAENGVLRRGYTDYITAGILL